MAHIVVNDMTPRVTFTVGGTPSSGPFNLGTDFVVFDPATDLDVFDDGVLLTYNPVPTTATEWKFTGTLIDGGYQGGAIDLGATVVNSTIVVQRDTPIERSSDFPYPAATLEIEGLNTQLDKVFAIKQDDELRFNRTLRQPGGDAALFNELPATALRASMFMAFDAQGQPIVAAGTSANLGPVSGFINGLLDDADAATARATLAAAPRDPQHLVLATNSELTGERVLTPSAPLSGADGGADNAYTLSLDTAFVAGLLRGHLYGLSLSNNVADATNDIDIAGGVAVNRANTHLMTLATSLTKQLDATWAVGTAAGGRDTGSIANGTWHVHAIQRSDTGVVDAILSLSPDTSAVVTITIASPGVVTWVGHGLVNGASVKFSTTGALPTGIVAGTTYFVVSAAADTFQISATQGGAAINTSGSQSGVHTAQATPVMPTNYDRFRRVGAIMRESAVIVPFVQDGDWFQRVTFLNAWTSGNPGTAAVTRTLGVPLSINVLAQINFSINAATAGLAHIYLYFSDLATTDSVPAVTLADGATGEDAGTAVINGGGNKLLRTNRSGQIRSRISSSDASLTFYGNTLGWFDRRGRDA
jgi:hypothetical protein